MNNRSTEQKKKLYYVHSGLTFDDAVKFLSGKKIHLFGLVGLIIIYASLIVFLPLTYVIVLTIGNLLGVYITSAITNIAFRNSIRQQLYHIEASEDKHGNKK